MTTALQHPLGNRAVQDPYRQRNRSKPLDVLRIVHVVSSLGVGGMERMLLQLASAQQTAGDHVSVLALRDGPLRHEAKERGLRVCVLNAGRIGRAMAAARHFWSERPHVVHVHNPTSLHYAVLSKIHPHASIVVTLHGDHDTHARLGTRFEWSLTNGTVAVSRAAASSIRLSHRAGTISVIHNGIEPISAVRRDNARTALGDSQVFLGVMVARIDGRKGHDTLLKSLQLLREAGVNARVLVVGDGAERTNIEQRARKIGVDDDCLRFLGTRSDINRLLAAADFFVLPSDIEGLPMAVLEAMAHGLPIIASNVGGIPEAIMTEREGLLIPPGDHRALALAIQRLYSSRALCRALGEAARARIRSDFSLPTMMEKYYRVYGASMGLPQSGAQ